MALPAMIQGYAEDQSKRFSALSQSLAQLGQQVGQQLANREYQRQAQAELPYMQEAMNRAIDRVQANDIAQGYREMMTAIPWNSTNPYLQQTAQGMMGAFERAAEFQQKSSWQKLQQEMMNKKYGGGEDVTYPAPTPEQLQDATWTPQPVSRTTPATRGIPAMNRGGGGGSQPLNALADQADQQAAENLPVKEIPAYAADRDMGVRFEDTVPEMDTSGGKGGFEFGWSYEEGYRPTANRRKSFVKEYNDFLNAPLEEQEKIKEQVQIPQEDVPEDKQVIPFRMALNPNIVGIVGPKSTLEVEEISQTFKDGSQEDKRKLITKNPLAATINDLQKADTIISGNNSLLNIHKQIDGNYSRVTTEREFSTDDPKNDTFKIFIDGKEVPDVITDANGDEAIGIMKAKDVAALTGKYGFVTSKAEAKAPAETAQKERFPEGGAKASQQKTTPAAPTATPEAPATTPAPAQQFSAENPFAKQATQVQTQPSGRTLTAERARGLKSRQLAAQKNLDSVNEQIKAVSNMMVGRRAATASEKAKRWEELNAEKKRLEGILAQ